MLCATVDYCCGLLEDNQPALRSYGRTPSSKWKVFKKLKARHFQANYAEISDYHAILGGLSAQRLSTTLGSEASHAWSLLMLPAKNVTTEKSKCTGMQRLQLERASYQSLASNILQPLRRQTCKTYKTETWTDSDVQTLTTTPFRRCMCILIAALSESLRLKGS